MRRCVSLVITALIALGCGKDGGPDYQAIVDRALLRESDLGSGWKLSGTEQPDASGDDDQLQRCAGKELDVSDETVAESETRTFERSTSDTEQQQVVVTSAALRNRADVDRLVGVVATQRFARCITTAMQDAISAQADGVSLTADPAAISTGGIAGADDGARVSAPVHLSIDTLRIDGRFDMLLLTTDRVVSLLFGFALGPPIDRNDLDGWAKLLVNRQKADD